MNLILVLLCLLTSGLALADNSITKADYDFLRDRIHRVFSPITDRREIQLVIPDRWATTTIDARADRYYSNWIVTLTGALARHKDITFLGMATIYCHEVGHHVAGIPLKPKYKTTWASSEAQSDYFVGTKCFNLIFTPKEHLSWLHKNLKSIDADIRLLCEEAHEEKYREASCMRAIYGGISASHFFKRKYKKQPTPSISTPSKKVVKKSYWRHPLPQCRLDTYLEAALCDKAVDPVVTIENLGTGYCTRATHLRGFRPLCWYKPPKLIN